jgi:hypothetical protein
MLERAMLIIYAPDFKKKSLERHHQHHQRENEVLPQGVSAYTRCGPT